MSKSIVVTPGGALFAASKKKIGVFRRDHQSVAPEFNAHNDPLLYRDTLSKPDSVTPGTGLGFIDTSVLLIHEKTADPTSAIRGFKLVANGVRFQIENPSIAGMKPQYSVTVLTSEKPTSEAKYRMTPSDAAFALSCLRNEYDMSNPALQKLAELFEREAPQTSPVRQKTRHSKNAAGALEFAFSENDRTYIIRVFSAPSSTPAFSVEGYLPNNTPFTRSMTPFEIGHAIPRISSGLSLDDSVRYSQEIGRMRAYQQGLNTPASQPTDRHASTRAIDFFG